MKKILLSVMAVAAIGFTSCGNKTQQGEAVDSVAIVDSIATGAAQETIDALSADIEAGDVSKLQATLESIKTSVAKLLKENPDVAKEYVAKVQTFLKENADKVKAIVGDSEAAAAAVSAITEMDPDAVVNGLLEQVGNAASDVKDAAAEAANEKLEEAKDAANQKVEEAKNAANQKAEEAKNAAKEKANEAIDNAAASAKKKLGL
jgi:ElaB/YqjD/DUF883 family membrane-anchored ribosome-binding protein